MSSPHLFDEETLKAILTNRAVRQQIASQSHLMFFHLYFSHYVKYPLAEFQKDIFRITEDITNKLACIVAFRGSAKSTLVTFSYSVWAVLGVQQKKFVLIICQTQAQARQHMANLKYELEYNDLLKSDMGPFREDGETAEWAMSSLVFTNTGARVMIASVDQSIRGIRHRQYRPDLIILDDIEDVNSVKTYEGRTKVSDWFSREIVPLSDLGTRIIIIGNLLHEDSLMMRLKRKMESNSLEGVYRWFPLINDEGKCLWEEKFDTPSKIENLRQSITDEASWLMEYLLVATSDTTAAVQLEWIRHYKVIPPLSTQEGYRGAYIGMDLAISEKERADKTAMVVCRVFGWNKNTRIYILPKPVNERMDFPTTLEKAKTLSSTLDLGKRSTMYIEDAAYQRALPQMLEKLGYPAVGVPSIGDKYSRLKLISNLIKDGTVLFPETGCEELIAQVTGLGNERHDDLADALSLVVAEVAKDSNGYSPFPDQGTITKKKGEFDYDPRISAGLFKKRF